MSSVNDLLSQRPSHQVGRACVFTIAASPSSQHIALSRNTTTVKLAFHDADTDTDFLARILAGMSARKSGSISRHRHPREDFCGDVGVSGESARNLGVGVGVVECELDESNSAAFRKQDI